MTMTPQRQSAKIYQFPVGGIKGLDAWKARKDAQPPVLGTPIIIDSWYHEAALNDKKPQ